MFRKIKIAALSAIMGIGTLASVPAQADSLYFSFGERANGAIQVQHHDRDRDRDRWDDRRDDRRDRDRWDDRRDRDDRRRPSSCSPRDAVEKAYRMGLRDVRVAGANSRIIRVTGRTRHDRVTVIFARAPHCPVIRGR